MACRTRAPTPSGTKVAAGPSSWEALTIVIDDRIEHRPNRVACREHSLLVTERREVDRLSRLEGLDVRIAGSVKGDLAAGGDSAQELPDWDIAVPANDSVDLQLAILWQREKLVDG